MDITQWYEVALRTLAVSSIVFYPQVHRYLRGSGKTTRLDVVSIVAFLVGNALCVAIGVKDFPSLIKRTGLMSSVNLMPLTILTRGQQENPKDLAQSFGGKTQNDKHLGGTS